MNRESKPILKSDRIISFITESIRNGKLEPGHAVPSINVSAEKFGVARKTVVRAYDRLKENGFIESRPKRGYFVINKKPDTKLKVLLIVHSFDGHWEILYNHFREQANGFCETEIFFHHYNIKMLELMISRNVTDYDLFIISSFNHPRIKNIIGRIPAYKVLVISRNDRLEQNYNCIVQDFSEGTRSALTEAHNSIVKYKKLNLSFPATSGHSETLKNGFLDYCDLFDMPNKVLGSLSELDICKNEAYLVIDDSDLIRLLEVSKNRCWELGSDIGVISYNETPLKKVIRDGISVLSCDFTKMAEEMAGFIKNQRAVQKTIPIEFIQRNSI
ncbi:MAG: GntR family transcriptional regulator [Prolixibacteraceae bacterium]